MSLTLGDKINKKLNESKKTAYWLSKKSGIAFGALYPILTNKRLNPTYFTMEKIADALDVSLDEFRTEKGE
ncbi:helix-turn-helix transcriptional regulator [Leuconostoc gelidum subsp. gasicomitatum]|uniref:helix-turn-helix domain-containing protein n=1 Tax=Leuconostoc gasicomitatum TaxID=115778 RepID=UPI001CC39800|nr:helix-turn-helix transcriptional regulator [Leuconostoc gasicomitatum]MBZ5952886.1 helix-turn-helix transcriptional regulator [Leuconostoc gasicomitatum]MBZ5968874.1 helix-turn-helix transcriptional regulator [Leuconostoc gasicomitatum]